TAVAGAGATIQQVVTGGPEGDVHYWVRVSDTGLEAGPGQADRPDATVTQSYETAAEVSQGRLGVEDAILAGRIRLSGDVALLVRHQAALQGVAGAFDQVRDRTTYE
ncbi:MAG: SCP2 sterol-binding domain-containing protein, partial [Acidimicrobiales bacterium]